MEMSDSAATIPTVIPPHARRPRILRRLMLCVLLFLPTLLVLLWLGASLPQPPRALAAPLQQDALAMQMFVTDVANGCTAAVAENRTSIVVALDTTIYYCYKLQNTTSGSEAITFTNHIIADGSATNVLATFSYPLTPTGSIDTWDPRLAKSISKIARTSGVETGIWAATSDDGRQEQTFDSINLTVVNPVVEARLTVARSATECGADTTITVPSNTNNVSLCISLTNRGDVPLTSHQVALTGSINWTGAISRTIAPGATLRITAADAPSFGIPSLTFPNLTSSANATINVTSRESNGISDSGTATANVTIGSSNVGLVVSVRSNPITRESECPRSNASSIQVVRNTLVYYCMHITNTGTVPLTLHHIKAITPSVDITFTYDLQPSASLVVWNDTLAGFGQPQVLGPITATRNMNAAFTLTSTNSSGFRAVISNQPSVTAVEPTATPTETPSETPAIPTNTPTITPTPIPTNTPFPTMTPTYTPVPPTPTPTRSFELSGVTTPTSAAGAGGVPQTVPTVDFLATAIARATFDTQATQNAIAGLPPPTGSTPPFSPLATPDPFAPDPSASDPFALAPAQLTLIAGATETAVALGGSVPDLGTVSIAPMPTPLPPTFVPPPSATPTPTLTPTATQRPIVYPTPLPPADFGTVFTQVVGSSAAATTFIFLLTGTLVFFGVAGGMLAFGFLRNSRRRYEVYEIEGDRDSDTQSGQEGGRTNNPRGDWPSSLP